MHYSQEHQPKQVCKCIQLCISSFANSEINFPLRAAASSSSCPEHGQQQQVATFVEIRNPQLALSFHNPHLRQMKSGIITWGYINSPTAPPPPPPPRLKSCPCIRSWPNYLETFISHQKLKVRPKGLFWMLFTGSRNSWKELEHNEHKH